MVCFSAIIERKPPWACGFHASPNTAMEPTNGAVRFRRGTRRGARAVCGSSQSRSAARDSSRRTIGGMSQVTAGAKLVRLPGGTMSEQFPSAVPEIRVSDVARAAVYYENCLGFHWDWGVEGIGQVSRGGCRIFLTDNAFRGDENTGTPVAI